MGGVAVGVCSSFSEKEQQWTGRPLECRHPHVHSGVGTYQCVGTHGNHMLHAHCHLCTIGAPTAYHMHIQAEWLERLHMLQ